MSRFSPRIRASLAAGLVAVALVGCTQSPTATPTLDCGGAVQKVLLADESATSVATFTATDVPKVFAIPATPAPTCYYKTTTTPPAISGVSYTVTHRTLVYLGLSDAQISAMVKALRATVGVAPWTTQFDDGVPAIPTASPTPTAAPVPTSYAGLWEYNFTGAPTADKGSMGYYVATTLTDGVATQAGLPAAVNMLRIETELRQPTK
ncbi:MAG: hypothetical protein HIU88_02250 [Acidobacteria bacterium]|nr:hypothetical protein [Acidobacteriota bacterium]